MVIDIFATLLPNFFKTIENNHTDFLKNVEAGIQQMLTKPKSTLDQRYINFLVDILDGDVNKIKIFSWNYDTQFQKAVEELNLKEGTKPYTNAKTLLNNEIKLNGSIENEEIKFAWETKEEEIDFSKVQRQTLKYQHMMINISDIVIIGYSFPFANRKIDTMIL